ncbi:MAG: hypothetical protein CVU90_01840 [Firmicutes bacterium HGW-Firmicutes-15]|nr:MAG: hypothetical protein CVU90_01840 [Firmicutes bacterium HGW-Firmicutes-15]
MKRGKRIMLWILAGIALLISGIVIWFILPYSPTKSEFTKLTAYQTKKMTTQNGIINTEDISGLPLPVQRYFQYCGYLGTPKMLNMKVSYNDVDFVLSPDKPKLKIKYIQYNFVDEPERIALIDTRMYGIPFEGIDAYQNGAGSMKGVIAKNFTLFNQKGEAMDKASLVTCLAESLLLPNLALQDYISWEEIDDTHAKATITYYGISASGIFTFDDNGTMKSFTTDDRENIDTNGNRQKVKWSAICGDYKEVNGIKYPTTLQAVWHFETGDLVYFDGKDVVIEYNVEK